MPTTERDWNPSTKDRLLNAEQVAFKLNCSKAHVWNLRKRGTLNAIKLGRRCVRFRASEVAVLVANGIG